LAKHPQQPEDAFIIPTCGISRFIMNNAKVTAPAILSEAKAVRFQDGAVETISRRVVKELLSHDRSASNGVDADL